MSGTQSYAAGVVTFRGRAIASINSINIMIFTQRIIPRDVEHKFKVHIGTGVNGQTI